MYAENIHEGFLLQDVYGMKAASLDTIPTEMRSQLNSLPDEKSAQQSPVFIKFSTFGRHSCP